MKARPPTVNFCQPATTVQHPTVATQDVAPKRGKIQIRHEWHLLKPIRVASVGNVGGREAAVEPTRTYSRRFRSRNGCLHSQRMKCVRTARGNPRARRGVLIHPEPQSPLPVHRLLESGTNVRLKIWFINYSSLNFCEKFFITEDDDASKS